MADFLMPVTQQPIIVINLIICCSTSCVLKVLVELQEQLYISSSFYVNYKYHSSSWSVELEAKVHFLLPLIDQAPRNDTTYLTTYTTHSHIRDTSIYTCIII